MLYYESCSKNPYFNLALEEYLFDKHCDDRPLFMLWQNNDTVVVGRYQNTVEEINRKYVSEQRINVVRRLSGGGAVFHDSGNLNYTFISRKDNKGPLEFRKYLEPVIAVLRDLGINADFSGRNDIIVDGKKVSGNAQYVKEGKVLHHGCIMLDTDIEKMMNALCVSNVKIASKGIKSIRSNVVNINECLNDPITIDKLKALLVDKLKEAFTIEALNIKEAETERITQLMRSKYMTWEWNYGNSPDYTMRKERRFEGGTVTAYIVVEAGYIKALRFYGDYFGEGDINEIEQLLTGHKLSDEIYDVLNEIDSDCYIHGVTARDLCDLLLL